MHRPAIRALLALALVFVLAAVAAPGAEAATRPHYDMQVGLAYGSGTLDVVQKTTLRNNTGGELPDLVFQVTPAFFDAFSLQATRIDGRNVDASMDGSVLTLNLESPLAPGGSAQAELRYQVRVPAIGGRFGRGNGMMALGNWFPVLAVYQDGWDRHQYVDVGDAFFTEVADFDIAVTSDVPVRIAASGASTKQDGLTQSFHADSVRDFAMAISDRYQFRGRDVEGVKLTAYSPNVDRLDVYLNAAEKSMRWYSANLAPYPYPTLSVADINGADDVPTAQEYPGLIFAYSSLGNDGGGTGSYSEYIVSHEVAHQWFYSLVGNDQVHDPWLDEALATYSSILYYRYQAPAFFDFYYSRNLSGYRARATAGGDRPVNSTIYDFPDYTPYFDIVYRKGAVFLNSLREMMGDDAFLGLLRDYIRGYANKIAMPRAFLDLAYSRAGAGFPPLVARYFSYGAFADGASYQMDVQWPEAMASGAQATLGYTASFPVSEVKVWLDNRLLYSGPGGGQAKLSDGIEEGEYALRLELTDDGGGIYQRAQRLQVAR